MELKKLPKEVSSLLRTGVTITSPSQCVVELVTNALDAGATSVAVRIDFRTYKIQVIDNGFGISKKNLDLIGKRYMTSKCHGLSELEGQLDKFGFRGEAIASLKEVCGLLNITSRAECSSNTYSKVFAHGKSTSVGLTADQRPSHGTTITVQDFLYNMPVRKKRIKETIDLEEMKSQLEALALVNYQVSFSLRNDASGKLILQTRKGQNTVDVFRNLYGIKAASCLRPLEFSEGKFQISGFIGKEVYHQKNLQYIYINNRLIVKTKFHKLINMILSKSFLLKAPGPWLNLPIPKEMTERFGIPMPKKSKHGIFIVNIKCPYTEYDITLDPRKTSIQFKNWDQVLHCVEEGVKSFLQQENLTVVSPEVNDEAAAPAIDLLDEIEQLDKEDALDEDKEEEEKSAGNKRRHKPSPQLHIARAVHGLPAKRRKNTVSEGVLQQEAASFPTSDVHSTSDEAEDSNSPSPKLAQSRRAKCHNDTEQILSNDDSPNEVDSPVNTWAKYKAREKAKSFKKSNKKTVSTGEGKLPPSLNKLKLYTKAANTLRKTFAHHNEKEQTVLDKPVTFFPVYSEESWLEDTSENITVSYETEDNHNFSKPPSSKLHKNSFPSEIPNKVQGEALVFQQEQHINNKTNHVYNETVSNLPNSSISNNPITSYNQDDNDKISQPQRAQMNHPLLNFQNMARVPENHQYDHVVLMQRHSASSPAIENYNYYTSTSTFIAEKNKDGFPPQSYDSRGSRHDEYEILQQSNKRTYDENNYKDAYELLWPTNKGMLSENLLSPISTNMDNFESPKSVNEDALSIDSLSEEHYEKIEARLREPLEQISREINKTRHSMLRSVSPSPDFISPQLSYDIFDVNKPSRSTKYEDIYSQQSSSHSDLKFQSLSSFAFDNSSKSKYKPSSHEKSSSPLSSCDILEDKELRLPKDTPLTRLSKHIADIENLTNKKLLEPNTYTNVKETPSMTHILDRQRLAGLDHSNITGGMPFISHNIHMLNQQESCEVNTVTDSNEDFLLSRPVSNQYIPTADREVIEEPVQNIDLLSATAVLQQLDPTSNIRSTSPPISLTSEDLLSTAAVLQQLGLPTYTTSKEVSISRQTLAAEDLLSSTAVLKQLEPQKSNITEGEITENLFFNTETFQKLNSPNYEKSSQISDHLYLIPLTPGLETDMQLSTFQEHHVEKCSTFTNLKELETPVINSNISLVPYSASIESEDMDTASCPTWRSICDAPDDLEDPVRCGSIIESTDSTNLLTETSPQSKIVLQSPPHISTSTSTANEKYLNDNITSQQQPEISKINQSEDIITETTNHNSTIRSPTTSALPPEKQGWEERVDPDGRQYYINTKSGVTSYEIPIKLTEETNYSMTPRHAFMPKGTSPVLQLACDKQTNALPLNEQEQQQLQHDVGVCLEDQLDTVKWTQQASKPSGFEQLVQKLLAESGSRVPETRISNACDQDEELVKVHNSLNQYKFSKDMLSSFKVLGQWDSKFVVTAVSMQSENQPHLLVMFDQHAVHERVRLERLTSGYQDESSSQFHGEEINPPLLIELSEREVRVMTSFCEEFTRLGLQFNSVSDTCVRITAVPTCLKLRDDRQRGSRGRSLEELVLSLVREQAHSVLQTRGVGAKVPSTLQAVLNSEACTGAIKFGDPLSDEECSLLLACLSSCQLPFQCAHGRPVLAPIADLKHLHPTKPQVKKPKLAGLMDKLLERME